jgi:hypothetical protein
MHNFGWSTFNTLKYHIVILLIGQVKFHNLEHLVFHPIFKSLLAKLALEGFPEKGLDFLSFIHEPLAVDPFSEARDVDHAHGAGTLAGADQTVWLAVICWSTFFFGAQADTADYLLSLVLAADQRRAT